MAYDEARWRVVLNGGIGKSGQLSDTWEWDGKSWTKFSPGGNQGWTDFIIDAKPLGDGGRDLAAHEGFSAPNTPVQFASVTSVARKLPWTTGFSS